VLGATEGDVAAEALVASDATWDATWDATSDATWARMRRRSLTSVASAAPLFDRSRRRTYEVKIQSRFSQHSVNIQSTFSQDSVNILWRPSL
jgi:hypothetical protein